MKLQLGLNVCSNAEYHSDNSYLSSSNLKLILKDREKFYQEKILGNREKQEEKAAFTEGSLTHSMILEPHLVETEYAFYGGLRKAGADYEAFARTTDKPVISKPQRLRAEANRDAFQQNPAAVDLIKGCEFEQTICAMVQGVPCKARFDSIKVEKSYIADVKTSAYPVDVDTFRLTVKQWNYELSAALYCAVAKAYYGKDFDFYFIAISKTEGVCEVFKTSESTMLKGQVQVTAALNLYKQCLNSGIWVNPTAQEVIESSHEILEV